MSVNTTLAGLSQTAASNGPDGASDPPSALDDQQRYHGSFHALHRDGKGYSSEVDVASAGTCDIGAANSQFVRITGTTAITSFGSNSAAANARFVRFADALTLTHNASTLILPGGANITTAAGDTCIATPISGGWVVSDYTRADGKAVIGALTSGTVVSASGTAVNFTDIPSWVKRITVPIAGLSTNGSSAPLVQIGDSGGIETSGYLGAASSTASGANPIVSDYTSGFGLVGVVSGVTTIHGTMTITLLNASTNTWVASFSGGLSNSNTAVHGGGSKSLSGTLDRIRITTANGTDTFDAGSVNCLYE